MFLYAVREKDTGELINCLTNPRRKYWEKKGSAETAIKNYNKRDGKLTKSNLELVVYSLTEIIIEH